MEISSTYGMSGLWGLEALNGVNADRHNPASSRSVLLRAATLWIFPIRPKSCFRKKFTSTTRDEPRQQRKRLKTAPAGQAAMPIPLRIKQGAAQAVRRRFCLRRQQC